MYAEKVVNHIVSWLKEYATKAGVNGFVVGVSGGIDSALTSTLCAKTGFDTLCVEMPIHQAPNQVSRALNHVEWLQNNFSNVSLERTDLTPVFDGFLSQVPSVEKEEDRFLTLANTRSRLRMMTLYYFAGLSGLLVAGTGNKVEDFGVGFFTKYGDGGVDLSPIADLMKSEVYTLAKFLGINEEIIIASPTDGLFGDDRTDEDQIGANYDELEWAMDMQSQKKNINEFSGRQKEVFEIYSRLNKVNQHKMNPIPVCVIPKNLK